MVGVITGHNEGAPMEEVPYTKLDLKRQAREQQQPEYLKWLAGMDAAIEHFLSHDVPEMPADPWSAEGLRVAEQAALRAFPSMDAVDAPENAELADRFRRYLGEVWVRKFEGRWVNVPAGRQDYYGGTFEPAIAAPDNPNYLFVVPRLNSAVHDRTGVSWSDIYRYSEVDYSKWVLAGRPDINEWAKIQELEILKEWGFE